MAFLACLSAQSHGKEVKDAFLLHCSKTASVCRFGKSECDWLVIARNSENSRVETWIFKKSVLTVNFFARLLMKEMEEVKSEYAVLQTQSQK